ncbi:uncharacterized protein LOC100034415 [Danio rerio]|uniref:Si:dkey-6a5.3 n=1 Tax=Danio rerio TaxID=7955 RepID=A0A0R4IPF7_DANRE|nr:uncharacterized protein LOC100034415 [Danio rerio]|eukprot:NP_001076521.1 uncharacterized protein LOC100034415 [Danio rerio]
MTSRYRLVPLVVIKCINQSSSRSGCLLCSAAGKSRSLSGHTSGAQGETPPSPSQTTTAFTRIVEMWSLCYEARLVAGQFSFSLGCTNSGL